MTENEEDDKKDDKGVDGKSEDLSLSKPSEKGKKVSDSGEVYSDKTRVGEKEGCFERWGLDCADKNKESVSDWASVQ